MTGTRVLLWGTAALIAVGVSTAGVAMATLSNRDDIVLRQSDVASQLASEQAGDDRANGVDDRSPEPSATPAPPPASDPASVPAQDPGATAIVRSRAGTLAVRCAGDQIVLDRWSPNPGYRVDDVTRAATRVSVWFESDSANDVEAVVQCSDGRAMLTENVEVDDHGGSRRG